MANKRLASSLHTGLQRLLTLGIAACRITLGLLVVNAGYQLIQRQGSFAFWSTESSITGIFVILLGGVFVALGIFPKFFNKNNEH